MSNKTPKNDKPSSSYISQKKTIASLSIFEKLGVIPVVATLLANVVTAFFTGVLWSKANKPSKFYRHICLTAIRTVCRKASARQQHLLIPPTDVAYLEMCKRRKIEPKSEVLADGTKAHWIGDSKAEKLIVNFHGGGYVVPASWQMFDFFYQTVSGLEKQGKSVACLMLSYDLAPGAVYPHQLQQATLLIAHILDTLKVSPSNIILTGDSAGANLLLSLLSHISHPHPSASVLPLTLDTPFHGAVLISPWVDFRLTAPSFRRNKYKDCIDPRAGKAWSTAWLGCPHPHTAVSDEYNQARTAPADWWSGLKVSEVLIVAGEEEVLVDGIREFEQVFRKGFEGHVEFLVADGEYHDQPSVDMQFGYTERDEGVQAKRIKSWIGERL